MASADCRVLCTNNGISDVKIINVICQMCKIIDFKTSAWLFFPPGTSWLLKIKAWRSFETPNNNIPDDTVSQPIRPEFWFPLCWLVFGFQYPVLYFRCFRENRACLMASVVHLLQIVQEIWPMRRRSRVQFLMVSLEFSIEIILPAVLCLAQGSTQPLTETSNRNISGRGVKAVGA